METGEFRRPDGVFLLRSFVFQLEVASELHCAFQLSSPVGMEDEKVLV